jgi:hypothetical protein
MKVIKSLMKLLNISSITSDEYGDGSDEHYEKAVSKKENK